MDGNPGDPSVRILLRRFLLDTLAPEERASVEKHLADSETWREALALERLLLDTLDSLPVLHPSRDLTQAAMLQIDAPPSPLSRFSTRKAIPWLCAALLLLCCAIAIPKALTLREKYTRAQTAHIMKQWGIVLKMYAAENRDTFPPVTRRGGYWIMDLEALWPDYIDDPAMLVNPSMPGSRTRLHELRRLLAANPIDWDAVTRIASESFTYTGFTARSNDDARLLEARRRDLPGLHAAGKGLSDRLHPLREGIERFFITDINNPAGVTSAQSDIPVLFESKPANGHSAERMVLFMDGHVDRIPEGASFPATEETTAIFHSPPPGTE